MCKKYHLKPETGFPRDMIVFETVKVINEIINENEPNKQEAKKACVCLENHIKECESLTDGPSNYLGELFKNIRNEAEEIKEKEIKKIVKWHRDVINNVNGAEQLCLKDAKEKVMLLRKNLPKTKQNLNEWRDSLKIVKSTPNEYWKSLTNMINHNKEEIKHLFEITQNDLLLNKQYKLIPRSSLNTNNFGDFICEVNSMKIMNWSHSEKVNQQLLNAGLLQSSVEPATSQVAKPKKWNCTRCNAFKKKEKAKCTLCGSFKSEIKTDSELAVVPVSNESK